MTLCKRCQNAMDAAERHMLREPGLHPIVAGEDFGVHFCGEMISGVCSRPICCEDGGGIAYRLTVTTFLKTGYTYEPVAYGDRVILAGFAEVLAEIVDGLGGNVLRTTDRWHIQGAGVDMVINVDPAWWFSFQDGIPWDVAKRGEA